MSSMDKAMSHSQSPEEGLPDNKAAARRQKKRELDRKAQRVARERTKNRIAHLEGIVEQLNAGDSDSTLSQLTLRLSQVTEQRDALVSVLKSLEETIGHHIPLASRSAVHGDPRRENLLPQPPAKSDLMASPPKQKQSSPPLQSFIATDVSGFVTADQWTGFPEQDMMLSHDGLAAESLPFDPSCIHQHALRFSNLPESDDDVIVPRPEWPCDCVVNEADQLARNTWREANEALGRNETRLSPSQLAIEDFTSQDTPVRVVLDGWDSVEKAGKMSLSWRKLRIIDETCFATCEKTERLAILRTMHLLITYHGDPSVERRNMVPRWFWKRPSQTIPHSYAIDFFVWPGLRERFIFSQHQYCTNLFWQLFRGAFRIMWPHDFESCYAHDPDTGRFVLSDKFEGRLKNINAWRMTPDFFAQFPELGGDIPVCDTIPPKIDTAEGEDIEQHLERKASIHQLGRDDILMHNSNFETTNFNGALFPPDSAVQANGLAYTPTRSGWEDTILTANSPWPSV